MTCKIELDSYLFEELQKLEIGEELEAYDVNGYDIYIERVNPNFYNAIEVEGKYYFVNYFAPNKVIIRYKGGLYTN